MIGSVGETKTRAAGRRSSRNSWTRSNWSRCCIIAVEFLAVLAIFALYGGEPTPHVNEAHYMGKAKHYWQPEWCQRDLFLSSAEAHLVFYWVAGGPTRSFDLPTSTWIVRWIAWGALAAGWLYFSRSVLRAPGTAVLSAMLLALLVRYLAMSGEWVLGGVEGKVFAYAFVFVALGAITRHRWQLVWPALGCASAFHVLVGGWAVIAAGLAWLLADRSRLSFRRMFPWLVLGGCISLFGLVPAIALSIGVSSEAAAEANRIYVLERLSHHLRFVNFQPRAVGAHLGLIAVAFGLAVWQFPDRRLRRLLSFGLGAGLITLIGISIDLWHEHYELNEQSARWLKYYWFRLSDATLPMILAVVIPLLSWRMFALNSTLRWGAIVSVVLLFSVDASRQAQHLASDPLPPAVAQSWRGRAYSRNRQERFDHWREVCQWIKENTDEDSLCVTPRNQQTFKWYAHRAEVANWKDVPQDAKALIAWRDRVRDIYEHGALGPLSLTDSSLRDMLGHYQADYLIVPKRDVEARARLGHPVPYPQVYPTDSRSRAFVVFRVTSADDTDK